MPDDMKPEPSLYESSNPPETSQNSEESAETPDAAETSMAAPAATMVAEPQEESGGSQEPPTPDGGDAGAEAVAAAAMQAMLDKETPEAGGSESRQDLGDEFPDLSRVGMERPVASQVEFQQLSALHDHVGTTGNIGLLMDVKMPVAIELGRTEMPISEILSLGPGSVVELDRLAGEPVDLLVNGKIIARGEVVVVDENFGVRITMLMSPQERLKSLG